MENEANREGEAIANLERAWPWYGASAVVLALGILAIGLFICAKVINERQRRNFTLTKALMGLQVKAATAHVWLEEAIEEKDETRMARAFFTLDWAEKLSQMILNGGEPIEGMTLQRLEEAKLRKQAEEITRLLSEYRNVGEERRRNPEASGMGSPLDDRFDRVHDTIMQRIVDLDRDVEAMQLADQKSMERLFFGILFAWFAVVVATAVGTLTRERRRRDARAARIKTNEQLRLQAEELRAHREHLTELVEARTVELTTANERLQSEIAEHEQTESALRASEKQRRDLTARLMNAQEEERLRIARELHDELGHALTLVKLRLKTIERRLPDSGRLKEDGEELIEYVDQVIDEVRHLSHDLSPTILRDLGLTEALSRLVDTFCKNFDCVATFDIADVADVGELFPEDAQIMIYRIIQETLTNIGKHARASNVSVTVQRNEDQVSFIIEDDGQGFNPCTASGGAYNGKGLGLATMKERALMLGGSLEVLSEEGRGTRIAFDIPIPGVKP